MHSVFISLFETMPCFFTAAFGIRFLRYFITVLATFVFFPSTLFNRIST
jgi:hypothetical protein